MAYSASLCGMRRNPESYRETSPRGTIPNEGRAHSSRLLQANDPKPFGAPTLQSHSEGASLISPLGSSPPALTPKPLRAVSMRNKLSGRTLPMLTLGPKVCMSQRARASGSEYAVPSIQGPVSSNISFSSGAACGELHRPRLLSRPWPEDFRRLDEHLAAACFQTGALYRLPG